MQVRKAIELDAANVAAVGLCVWVDTYATEGVFGNISRFVLSEFTEDKIRLVIQNKTVFTAFEGEFLWGYIVLDSQAEEKAEIENLYVLPRFQGRGVGRCLLEAARSSIAKPVWLSVWEGNSKAIGFYRRLGFQETGELCFDLYGDQIRNIILELPAES